MNKVFVIAASVLTVAGISYLISRKTEGLVVPSGKSSSEDSQAEKARLKEERIIRFELVLASTTNGEIPFDAEWRNGTGYYNYAVKLVKLEPGQTAWAHDTDSNRKLLFKGYPKGTLVVFERYNRNPNEPFFLARNGQEVVEGDEAEYVECDIVTIDHLETLFGK